MDWENEKVFQKNTLPPRAYFLPPTSLCLNGTWKFEYGASPLRAPDATRSALSWSECSDILVPGHWQLQGYGQPLYTNIQYPFNVDPPLVPSENSTGSYFRTFEVPIDLQKNEHYRLRFDGVDSAFHVFLNGTELGYSQGSRNPAEFDVSAMVDRDGENELLVRVYRWCDGSYIEDQDQWWLSGIFRDVHLLTFPSTARIEDYTIRTTLDTDYIDSRLSVSVKVSSECEFELRFELFDVDGNPVKSAGAVYARYEVSQHEMDVENPHKWTAEDPYLYKLTISLLVGAKVTQMQTQLVGFRQVQIKDGNLTVNGSPILLKGVNRHDHHPLHGRAVPLEFMRADLNLMKQHNINAIRCSHYPSHPGLFQLCDELGFWVVDEADLECHGFAFAAASSMKLPEGLSYDERIALTARSAAEFTSDKESWREAYLDRMRQLVHRDKNHPCVIVWSLGNESFYGRNHAAMYELGKQLDPTRPIHYEGDTQATTADMYSYMYVGIDRLQELATAEGDTFEKPIILCEYAHAMGNGPGALEDYQKAFRSHRRLQGGFIWEWANHGLWKKSGNGDGKGFYAYGGDFGDQPNDGTFVMDGLCFSDHTATPGLVELKKVFEPVKVAVDGNIIEITNVQEFSDLSGLVAEWDISSFPIRPPYRIRQLGNGELHIANILAGETASVSMPDTKLKSDSHDEKWLSLSFRTRSSMEWAPAGHEVAWSQHCLDPGRPMSNPSSKPAGTFEVVETKLEVRIVTPTSTLCFDKCLGELVLWEHEGFHIIAPGAGPKLTVWRAPTDNDLGSDAAYWKQYGLNHMSHSIDSMWVTKSDERVEIMAVSFFGPPVLAWKMVVTTKYTVRIDGSLVISTHVLPKGPAPTTSPRIGLTCQLPKALERVAWFGRGPGESYRDSCSSQKIGIYKSTASDLHTPYEVPQENGNRTDTRWVALVDENGTGIMARRQDVATHNPEQSLTFDFSAQHYDAEDLEAATHPPELKRQENVILRLDAAHHGLGTGSCGPGVRDEYQLKLEEVTFEFALEPVKLSDLMQG